MLVLVDTPIWSLALRRKSGDLNRRELSLTQALEELVRDGRAQLIGVVRQELLSGIRDQQRFEKLRNYLSAFDDPALAAADYETAAAMHNRCRGRGVTGSAIDFLLCAVAELRHWQIFTTDKDFEHYRRVLALKIYVV
jgi:predicted nucleic acid-binding protein